MAFFRQLPASLMHSRSGLLHFRRQQTTGRHVSGACAVLRDCCPPKERCKRHRLHIGPWPERDWTKQSMAGARKQARQTAQLSATACCTCGSCGPPHGLQSLYDIFRTGCLAVWFRSNFCTQVPSSLADYGTWQTWSPAKSFRDTTKV